MVTISEVGENSDAFFCFSSTNSCCRKIGDNAVMGNWYYPNNTRVGSRGTGSIYRNRGPKTILLHRVDGTEVFGLFRCELPDIMAYFGIYPQHIGKHYYFLNIVYPKAYSKTYILKFLGLCVKDTLLFIKNTNVMQCTSV